ncbi:Alpha,alpha-trehalose-phosphate synthase UDP-forming, partial [Phytophthora palmivora]
MGRLVPDRTHRFSSVRKVLECRMTDRFKEREAALLRELSALYTKLNQVREKRVKEEQESGAGADNDTDEGSRRRRRVLLVTRTLPFWLVSEDAQSQWRAEFPEHA